jgi:hypothetical protein
LRYFSSTTTKQNNFFRQKGFYLRQKIASGIYKWISCEWKYPSILEVTPQRYKQNSFRTGSPQEFHYCLPRKKVVIIRYESSEATAEPAKKSKMVIIFFSST